MVKPVWLLAEGVEGVSERGSCLWTIGHSRGVRQGRRGRGSWGPERIRIRRTMLGAFGDGVFGLAGDGAAIESEVRGDGTGAPPCLTPYRISPCRMQCGRIVRMIGVNHAPDDVEDEGGVFFEEFSRFRRQAFPVGELIEIVTVAGVFLPDDFDVVMPQSKAEPSRAIRTTPSGNIRGTTDESPWLYPLYT